MKGCKAIPSDAYESGQSNCITDQGTKKNIKKWTAEDTKRDFIRNTEFINALYICMVCGTNININNNTEERKVFTKPSVLRKKWYDTITGWVLSTTIIQKSINSCWNKIDVDNVHPKILRQLAKQQQECQKEITLLSFKKQTSKTNIHKLGNSDKILEWLMYDFTNKQVK